MSETYLNNYVVVDLETTGLNPKSDKIIEIGAVRVENGQVTETFSTYVNPFRKLEERIVKLTGITQEMVDSAPKIAEVLPQFLAFEKELPLVGHKILFDYSFLKKACQNEGYDFERTGVDTLHISRIVFPELPSKTLQAMCEYFQIPLMAHRAFEDASATKQLYELLKETCRKHPDVDKIFAEKQLIYQVKKESKASERQKKKLQELIESMHVSVDFSIDELTRNEVNRYYDKIKSGYYSKKEEY